MTPMRAPACAHTHAHTQANNFPVLAATDVTFWLKASIGAGFLASHHAWHLASHPHFEKTCDAARSTFLCYAVTFATTETLYAHHTIVSIGPANSAGRVPYP